MVVSSFRPALLILFTLGLSLSAVHAQDDASRPRVKMSTSLGDIVVELYNETPSTATIF